MHNRVLLNSHAISFSPIHLAYNPYFFGEQTVFFPRNKLANSTFSHGLSTKRTGARSITFASCRTLETGQFMLLNLWPLRAFQRHHMIEKIIPKVACEGPCCIIVAIWVCSPWSDEGKASTLSPIGETNQTALATISFKNLLVHGRPIRGASIGWFPTRKEKEPTHRVSERPSSVRLATERPSSRLAPPRTSFALPRTLPAPPVAFHMNPCATPRSTFDTFGCNNYNNKRR
jgi:hypothetical protein